MDDLFMLLCLRLLIKREPKIIVIENGKVVNVLIKPVRGRRPLPANILKTFKEFVNIYSEKIVQKWIDYFVLHKEVTCENIEGKIK